MSLLSTVNEIKSRNAYEELVDVIPYAKTLGVQTSLVGDDIVCTLPFKEENIGNPHIPTLHGGVTAGFMENAAIFHLLWRNELKKVPKIIDFSIDYLLPGLSETVYSQCTTTRLGNRIALCHVKVWQHDSNEPIALARCHFLLS